MYQFIDTNELRGIDTLPSEALKINGQWIEEQIPGYRTLNVSGREMLSNEIADLQVGSADGRRYLHKRYEPRTITVTYQLIASSNSAFRDAYNKLNALLDVEEAHLIFKDEEDKYFIGTRSGFSDVMPGVNSVTGEIEFYCTDPFKYSVKEFEVSPTLDGGTTFAVDYKGTYKAFPVIEARMNGDNGFLGFIGGDSHILQFGNVEEVDGIDEPKSETLIDEVMSDTMTGWRLNDTTIVHSPDVDKQVGTIGMSTIQEQTMLRAFDYGTGNSWHGPSWSKKVPADSKGHIGAKNCTLSWKHCFASNGLNNIGVVQFLMTDKNKKNVAAITFFKHQLGTSAAKSEMYVDGKILKQFEFDTSLWNNITGLGTGRTSITKYGEKFEFNVEGVIFAFAIAEMKDVEVSDIGVYFGLWGINELMYINGLHSIKFVSHNATRFKNIPNRFGEGDILSVDCNDGSINVNNVPTLGLGALGNDWEKFHLLPGMNQIRCVNSPWAKKPNFKLKYREVYL